MSDKRLPSVMLDPYLTAQGPTAAALAVLRDGSDPAWFGAGWTSVQDEHLVPAPVGPDTLFDLASVSKIVTTLAVMRLRSAGALDLDDRVRTLLPRFRGGPKDQVTVRQLLLHRAGLWEWWPLYANADDGPAVLADPAAAVERAARLPLRYPPGDGRHYSDLGFQLLGAVVEAVHGTDLRRAVASLVTGPLGLTRTGYGPVRDGGAGIAATSRGDRYEQHMIATGEPYPVPVPEGGVAASREHWLAGEVSDCNAHHAFGGVAGHAGIFSTAQETARLGAVMLGGRPGWPAPVLAEFSAAGPDPDQALGWRRAEVPLDDASTATVLGHPGFTGTEVCVAPEHGVAWALLTNRLHPASTPLDITRFREHTARLVLTGAL